MSKEEKRTQTAFGGVPRKQPGKETVKKAESGQEATSIKAGGRQPRTVTIGFHGYKRDE